MPIVATGYCFSACYLTHGGSEVWSSVDNTKRLLWRVCAENTLSIRKCENRRKLPVWIESCCSCDMDTFSAARNMQKQRFCDTPVDSLWHNNPFWICADRTCVGAKASPCPRRSANHDFKVPCLAQCGTARSCSSLTKAGLVSHAAFHVSVCMLLCHLQTLLDCSARDLATFRP